MEGEDTEDKEGDPTGDRLRVVVLSGPGQVLRYAFAIFTWTSALLSRHEDTPKMHRRISMAHVTWKLVFLYNSNKSIYLNKYPYTMKGGDMAFTGVSFCVFFVPDLTTMTPADAAACATAAYASFKVSNSFAPTRQHTRCEVWR